MQIGMIRMRFILLFLKNFNMSRAFNMTNRDMTNNVNSRAMFIGSVILMFDKPNSLADRGQSSWSCPPIKKSPIKEWDANAAK